MAFLETPRFPDDIAYGTSGGPRFRTSITQLGSGFEIRNAHWEIPIFEYNVAYGIRRLEQLYTLMVFFSAVKGRAHGFRFKDFSDFRTVSPAAGNTPSNTDMNLAAWNSSSLAPVTGDGATTQFQLAKAYTQGALTSYRKISKPVSGTILIAVAGTPQTEGPNYTVDYTTGKITFSSAPAASAALTWGGEFDVPCRFASDILETNMDSYESGSAVATVAEIRL